MNFKQRLHVQKNISGLCLSKILFGICIIPYVENQICNDMAAQHLILLKISSNKSGFYLKPLLDILMPKLITFADFFFF